MDENTKKHIQSKLALLPRKPGCYLMKDNTGKVILKEHMEHCLVHAIEEGDFQAIEEFNKAIEQFL